MSDFEKKLQAGRELESRVRGLLHHEQDKAAKREFAKKWKGVLPNMPTRFTSTLEDIEADSIMRLLSEPNINDIWDILNIIELKLTKRLDPRRPQRVAVYYQDAPQTRRHIIGFLPKEDAEYLHNLGPARKVYTPCFRELHNLEGNLEAIIVIEFIRPELRICSACGKEHFNETINCVECRSKRRRLQSDSEAVQEKPVSVPVTGAFQKIQERNFKRKGELDDLIKQEKND